MANLLSALKSEITRLARKETRTATAALQKTNTAHRKNTTDLKRRITVLEQRIAVLERALKCAPRSGSSAAAQNPVTDSAQATVATARGKVRFTGNSIVLLRRKLKLPVSKFAQLVGVTPKWIYMWERKDGVLRLRNATQARLLLVRGMGVREAARELAAKKTQ